jgi:hypothetical protein
LYNEEKDRGFSQGSILALQAIGPQENYLLSNNFEKSQFSSLFRQYSNFVMYQRVIPFPPPNPSYQANTLQIELRPTEIGSPHLEHVSPREDAGTERVYIFRTYRKISYKASKSSRK